MKIKYSSFIISMMRIKKLPKGLERLKPKPDRANMWWERLDDRTLLIVGFYLIVILIGVAFGQVNPLNYIWISVIWFLYPVTYIAYLSYYKCSDCEQISFQIIRKHECPPDLSVLAPYEGNEVTFYVRKDGATDYLNPVTVEVDVDGKAKEGLILKAYSGELVIDNIDRSDLVSVDGEIYTLNESPVVQDSVRKGEISMGLKYEILPLRYASTQNDTHIFTVVDY